MLRIAFCGKMGSGKSTAANILLKKHKGISVQSFSTPMKRIAKEFFGMTEKDRDLLIAIGEKLKEIDKHVWLKYFLRYLDGYPLNLQSTIIDDLRFPFEAKGLREHGFIIIRVIRVKGRQATGMHRKDDPTETAQESIKADYTIKCSEENNDLWRVELERKLDQVIWWIANKPKKYEYRKSREYKTVYLSLPYTKDPKYWTNQAKKRARILMKKRPDLIVITPHLTFDVLLGLPSGYEHHEIAPMELHLIKVLDIFCQGLEDEDKISYGMLWERAYSLIIKKPVYTYQELMDGKDLENV